MCKEAWVTTTVLIAEDNDDVRAVLQRLLDRAGFSVVAAADGRAALQSTREHRPDVVLTDLDMPHMNGMQLCGANLAEHIIFAGNA